MEHLHSELDKAAVDLKNALSELEVAMNTYLIRERRRRYLEKLVPVAIIGMLSSGIRRFFSWGLNKKK